MINTQNTIKQINLLKVSLVMFFGVLLFFAMSCSTDTGSGSDSASQETASVRFSTSMAANSFSSANVTAQLSNSMTDADYAIVTLTENGIPVSGWEDKTIQLLSFGSGYMTNPLDIVSGSYKLEKFLIVDSGNNVIFATPLGSSPKAYLVDDPLEIDVVVAADQLTTVVPEVISTEESSASDFGYVSFIVEEVETFWFRAKMFVFNDQVMEWEDSDAHLEIVSDGTTLYQGDLSTDTNTVWVNKVDTDYQVTFSKEDYADWSQTFSSTDLENFAASPLLVYLERPVTWDENTEPIITDMSSDSISFEFSPLADATKYEVSYVSSWSPLTETLLDTFTTSHITTSLVASQGYKIKALDNNDEIIDSRLISGGVNHASINNIGFTTGTFYDDFEDGIVGSNYHQIYSGNIVESNGYLELYVSSTDIIPAVSFSYDTEGKRYFHVSAKILHHYGGTNYAGSFRINAFENNFSQASFSLEHMQSINHYGLFVNNYLYDPTGDTAPTTNTVNLEGENFDNWVQYDVVIDSSSDEIWLKVDSNSYTFQREGWNFRNRYTFALLPWGWFTGHYIRVDDLLLESSDSPFSL